MLLNRQIGQSFNEDGTPDGEPYIDGNNFAEELLWLDTMGKKRIQVWINSPGGSVTQGMSIYNAILKSKTPVDTYNAGIAASIAGAIFTAGRKRVMSDYSLFMMHPVSGGDDKSLAAFNESVSKMLTAKTAMTEDQCIKCMSATTWLNASDCKDMGLCTDIEETNELNRKGMPVNDVVAMHRYADAIVNNAFQNNSHKMNLEKITNRLKLTPGANEDVILEAINRLETARNEAVTDKENLQAQLDALNSTKAELDTKINELQTQLNSANAEKEAAQEAQATTEATDAVNKFKNRIGNKAEVIASWVNLMKKDKAGTTAMLEALPLNMKAPDVNLTGDVNPAFAGVAGVMAEIQAREAAARNKHN